MICRKDITVRKTWTDDNNAHNTRPASAAITLLRDGEIYKTAELKAAENWAFTFKCLPVWRNSVSYEYKIDEAAIPGYSKSVNGYTITNTLNTMTVAGIKTWDDNHNAKGLRPASATIILMQNGKQHRTLDLITPAGADTAPFSFENVSFADAEGKPYAYTVDEGTIANYKRTVEGFNITNTLISGGFSFSKTSAATGLSLQGAIFEIRQNGALIDTSASDAAGKVSFSGLLPGTYQMAETVSPVGYMENIDIYDVAVSDDGSVTVGGMPADEFSVQNTPAVNILLERATAVEPAYMAAPNTWPLHGTIDPDLYMLDRVLITLPETPLSVKWAYGVQDTAYFRTGGGIDITAAYQHGIPAPINSVYTVYASFAGGRDAVGSITVDRLRDGSAAMPYLLINFTTADALEPSVPGTNQFTLYYMQGGGVKLTQHYELYENIDMNGRTWQPIGTLSGVTVWQGFTGGLYGNGHDIGGIMLGSPERDENGLALFRAVTDGAVIEDLGLTDYAAEAYSRAGGFVGVVNVRSGGTVLLKDLRFSGSLKGGNYAGGIVAYADIRYGSSLIIDGCTSDASVATNSYSAGIMGYCYPRMEAGSVSVNNCRSSGTVNTVSGSSAGIIGYLDGYAGVISVVNCVNRMSVAGPFEMGGIIGYITHRETAAISISSCCNFGSMTGRNTVGGIAGIYYGLSPDNNLKIENCYNGGKINVSDISGSNYYGGLVGYASGSPVVQNSYNTGDLDYAYTAVSNLSAGGISGTNGTIKNCAAICGLVSGSLAAARITKSTGTSLDNNVAFDGMRVLINGVPKSPLDTGSAGADGISVTAAEIKTQALYENNLGWDFTNVWSFGNGAYTLPVLRGIPLSLQPDVLPPHLA